MFCTGRRKPSERKRMPGAYADLQAFQKEYPSSAMREQFLEAFAPTAVETGHAQAAIEALNDYAPTNTRPALLLERAQAYKAAHQLPHAARDYQTLYYKYPLSDEAKAAGTTLPRWRGTGPGICWSNGGNAGARAQIIFDAHKWRDARIEYAKVLALLKDPLTRKPPAQLRIAQAKIPPRAPTILSSLVTPDPEVDAERLFGLRRPIDGEKRIPDVCDARRHLRNIRTACGAKKR